ncbi:efflux RND transporter permease subunit [candidate division KSB1 bacterium]|nr:efflux RND transporter permease subunit [candidate division KSB1 bacterium]
MWSKIISFSLKNKMLILASAFTVLILGYQVFQELPIDVYPDINDPRVTILTEAPGFAPEEVETLVTFPLESAFNGVPLVNRVRSSSGVGISVIFVEFEWGTDIYRARQMVTERLQMVVPTLPDGVEAPFMAPIISRLGEIVEYAMVDESGKLSSLELRDIADWIVQFRLKAAGGIANVINQGGFVKQYQVLVHPGRLLAYDLSLSDVREALEKDNLNTPGGFFLNRREEFLIRGLGRVRTVTDIENIVIDTRDNGVPILIKDVADVRIHGPIARRGSGSLNGVETVLGKVIKQPNTNTFKLTKKIKDVFEELELSLPEGVKIKSEYVQADLIERAVNTVKDALMEGAVLVTLILVIFLFNIRTSIVSLTAIPLSLILAVIVLYWQGLTLNTMTLAGLAIAIGMVVDDGIIDVENIFRRLREYFAKPTKETPTEVVLRASNEIRASIVFATLIIVLVFIPLFTLTGIEGRLFSPLGLAVVVAMAASLLVALTVVPVLCDLMLTRGKQLKTKESPVVRWVKAAYRPILNFMMKWNKFVLLGSVSLIMIALLLIPFMGREFLPILDEGTFVVNSISPPGTSLEESQRIGYLMEEALHTIPEVTSTSNRIGRAEQDEHAEGVSYGEMLVNVLPVEEREKNREELLADMREILGQFPGVAISIGQPIQHRIDHLLSGVTAQVAIKIFGPDLNILRQKAQEVASVVREVRGVADLQVEPQVLIDIPQLKIEINRKEAARYGLAVQDISHFIETAFNGEVVSQVVLGQRQYDLVVMIDDENRNKIDRLENLRISTPTGPKVPLKRVADITIGMGPNTINRENVSRRIVVQCNVQDRDLGSFVEEVQDRVAQQISFPEGYFITYGGQFESQQRATRLLLIETVFVIAAIFILLQMSIGTWKLAGLVVLNLPLALVGGVFSIFISGGVLSVSSLVGFILLLGIAVRNGIILVTHINDLRFQEGKGLLEAILEGAGDRISPVLMTALTTGLGLLPLALSTGSGAELQKPLAIVIVGGMVTSTILTLLALPVFYYLVERKSEQKRLAVV